MSRVRFEEEEVGAEFEATGTGYGDTNDEFYQMPDNLRDFIEHFHRQLKTKNIAEITLIYEVQFPKFTEMYFKDQPWPTPELIAQYVDEDQSFPTFMTLYKELYFRHIYANLQPSLEQRLESYENYCALFNFILGKFNDGASCQLELPNQWLWDIIDEFIYQFQSFCQFRAKNKIPSEAERLFLENNPTYWNVHIVLNVLHSLIDKSNIVEQLRQINQGLDPVAVAGPFGEHNLYKMLGYFSLIGLCRLHVLLGDYYQALKVIEEIDLSTVKKALYCKVSGSHITVFYYVGFSYLMMRRYQDAVRTFSSILFYIMRSPSFQTKSSGWDIRKKTTDQLFSLLAIAMTLSPQRIDEGVHQQLLEKCGERMLRMRAEKHEDEERELLMKQFEDLFQSGCPKFLSPVTPNYDTIPAGFALNAYKLQLKLFLSMVRQQILLPTIQSYLKLYSTMSIDKLVQFLDFKDSPRLTKGEVLRVALHQYKHKTNQVVWVKGTPLDGERQSSTDVDFFINKSMIHIADVKVERSYGDYFILQVHKMIQSANE